MHLPIPTILAAMVLVAAPAARAHVQLGAALDGAQEVPPVATAATATATFLLNPDGTLDYQVTPSGLSGPVIMAHLHAGARGVSGAPIVTLDNGLSGTTGVLSDDAREKLLAGGLYVNLHTAENLNGEIRGQVELTSVSGTTCSCADAASPGAFKSCVKKAIKTLEKDERKGDEIKALKRYVAKSSCGKTKVPKKAVACCLPLTPDENIVIEPLCAGVSEKACTKLGGTSRGAGSTCVPTNPCATTASPSGAFLQ
jgi:hypothetical protein